MAKIVGIEGMTGDQLKFEVQNGGRFVMFQYCVSILVMSFKRSSDIRFLRAGESHAGLAAPYCLLSLLLGWWGIPWGPIWTVSTTYRNLRGGLDVTGEVLQSLSAPPPQPAA
jgi:hypothetical protein